MIKVWVTKYALTQGIFEKTGEVDEECPKMFCARNTGGLDEYYHYPEWHYSLSDAKEHAFKMKLSKIKSLKQKIVKLENIKIKF